MTETKRKRRGGGAKIFAASKDERRCRCRKWDVDRGGIGQEVQSAFFRDRECPHSSSSLFLCRAQCWSPASGRAPTGVGPRDEDLSRDQDRSDHASRDARTKYPPVEKGAQRYLTPRCAAASGQGSRECEWSRQTAKQRTERPMPTATLCSPVKSLAHPGFHPSTTRLHCYKKCGSTYYSRPKQRRTPGTRSGDLGSCVAHRQQSLPFPVGAPQGQAMAAGNIVRAQVKVKYCTRKKKTLGAETDAKGKSEATSPLSLRTYLCHLTESRSVGRHARKGQKDW